MLAGRCSGTRMLSTTRCVAPTAYRALAVFSRVQLREQASTVCRYSNGTSQYTSYELSTEDKLEITEMMNKFDMVLNLGQQERIGQFFSPDAVVNVDMGTTAVPVKAIKGAEPIVEYFKSVRTMAAGNRHITCNIVVEPDGLRAAKVTAYRLLHKAQNPPVLLAAGIIQDKLVNTNGEWKFSVRNFIMDPPAQHTPMV